MKRVFYSGLAFLVLAFLTVPAWAQKGGRGGGAGKSSVGASHSKASSHRSASSHSSTASERSNKGGEVRGIQRAKEVQAMNTRADTERGFTIAPGLEKAESHQVAGKAAGKAKGSSQSTEGKARKEKAKGGDTDADESKD